MGAILHEPLVVFLLVGGMTVWEAWTWHALCQARRKMSHVEHTFSREIAGLTQQLALVAQAATPLWVLVQMLLVKELTHAHAPALDALLSKLGPPVTLTAEEEAQLLAGLQAREADASLTLSPSERDAARLLPLILARVKRDMQAPLQGTPLTFQMVSIVPDGDVGDGGR